MLRKFALVTALAIGFGFTRCNDSPCNISILESMETAALVAEICAQDESACAGTALEEDLQRVSFYCFYHDEYALSITPDTNPRWFVINAD